METALTLVAAVGNGRFDFADLLLLWIILGILQFLSFWIATILVVRSSHYTGGGKFLWFVVILFVPILGGLGYLVLGRSAQLVRSA
jgi:hypothetical protein